MKYKIYHISAICIYLIFISTTICKAQVPEKISYQAVVRDQNNKLITNTKIGIQINILKGSATGYEIYSELQTPRSNSNGLISFEIGEGTSSDDFTTIDWSDGSFFINIKYDLDGGNNYTISSTSQLLSVPFALYAKTAENVKNITLTGTEALFTNWDKNALDDFDGDYNSLSNLPDLTNFITNEVDGDNTNEIQNLALNDDILTITNNTNATEIDLSKYLDDTNTQLSESDVDNFVSNNGYLTSEADGDVTNEIQDLSLTGNSLTITNNASATGIDLSKYLDDTNTQLSESEVDSYVSNNGYLSTEADGDVTNEIQDLFLTENSLTITNNESATVIDLSKYLDDTNTQLSESDVDNFVSNNGYLTSEADGDVTNELQDLSLTGNSLTITNNASATGIDLSKYLDDTDTQLSESEVDNYVSNNGYLTSETDGDITNEIQDLQLTGSTLKITNNVSATEINLGPYLGTNTDEQTLSLSSNDLSISNGNTIDLSALIDDADADPINEIQDLQLISNTLTITNNGSATSIDLSKYLDNSDTQLTETEVDDFVSNNGYLLTETDPIFSSSDASTITSSDISTWNSKQDQISAGTGIEINGTTISTTTYQVGDFAHGGIVFWVDHTGQHGLVCALEDQSAGIRWYAGTYGYTRACLSGIGTGAYNTAIILSSQAAIGDDGNDYAASICASLLLFYNGKSYGDWHLPSILELMEMYNNRVAINAALSTNGGIELSEEKYWSSDEASGGMHVTHGYSYDFSTNMGNYDDKSNSYRVRAVRSF